MDPYNVTTIETTPETSFFKKNYRILNGSVLKILAVLSMLVDHSCEVLSEFIIAWTDPDAGYGIYRFGRGVIGRLAFPIFCFLLVQGFRHTKDRKKYALRLGIFAVISEVPFDLAFFDQIFYWNHNNVFLTLFLGLIALILIERLQKKPVLAGLLTIGIAWTAELINTDYGAFGVLLIVLLYFSGQNPSFLLPLGVLTFVVLPMGTSAVFSFLLMCLYNGKRGLRLKYFFYLFYPVHLLLLYALRWYLTFH